MAVLEFTLLDPINLESISDFIVSDDFTSYLGSKEWIVANSVIFDECARKLKEEELSITEKGIILNTLHRNALTQIGRSFIRRLVSNNTFLWSLPDVHRCNEYIKQRYIKCSNKLLNPDLITVFGEDKLAKIFPEELEKCNNTSITFLIHVLVELVERKNFMVKIVEKIKQEKKKGLTYPANGLLFVSPVISSLLTDNINDDDDISSAILDKIKAKSDCIAANKQITERVTLSLEAANSLHVFAQNRGITWDEALLLLL